MGGVMMRYVVKSTVAVDPAISFAEWERAKVEKLSFQPWDAFYQPIETTFQLLRGPQGISVYMHTNERNLRAAVTEQNGPVHTDSCMEFFFQPCTSDARYLNFECNPRGVAHIEIGTGRYDRSPIECDRDIFHIRSTAEDGNWSLQFYIPDSFLQEYFASIDTVWRANFYKCGEHTDHSHFITWAEVKTADPDFHTPEFFGELAFV